MPTTLTNLHSLLIEQLRDLLHAERQLLKALPKMAEAASDPALKQAFEDHLNETETHVERLITIFSELDIKPRGKTCQAMKGLIKEGEEAIEAKSTGAVRDAHLIASAQRVEHYEIAAYGTIRAFAEELRLEPVIRAIEATLKEEGEANSLLTSISRAINPAAVRP